MRTEGGECGRIAGAHETGIAPEWQQRLLAIACGLVAKAAGAERPSVLAARRASTAAAVVLRYGCACVRVLCLFNASMTRGCWRLVASGQQWPSVILAVLRSVGWCDDCTREKSTRGKSTRGKSATRKSLFDCATLARRDFGRRLIYISTIIVATCSSHILRFLSSRILPPVPARDCNNH